MLILRDKDTKKGRKAKLIRVFQRERENKRGALFLTKKDATHIGK